MSLAWWIIFGVLAFLIMCLMVIGYLVYDTQKGIDAPFGGMLMVEKTYPDEPAMVYFLPEEDPKTFKDGAVLKIRVQIVQDPSQGKHGS